MIVVGGVIPPEDVETLKEMGAAAVYPPGGVIADIAQSLLSALNEKLGYAQPARREGATMFFPNRAYRDRTPSTECIVLTALPLSREHWRSIR